MTTERTAPPGITAEDRMPGDLTAEQLIARMIRVDHAGEFGAVRIYAGQLAMLDRLPSAPAIRKMAAKERAHLKTFEKLIADRHVRPTVLMPLWHVTGFALGAATALISEKAAMACTVAVEEVIEEHYAGQAARLGDDEAELRDLIEEFRGDELEHRDAALARGAEQAPAYPLLSGAIKVGSRLAIWLSERI